MNGGTTLNVVRALLGITSSDEAGQGLAEYALILALIAVIAIVALLFLGNQVSAVLSEVGGSI
jgi:Flp pilus assembly pilin Flp